MVIRSANLLLRRAMAFVRLAQSRRRSRGRWRLADGVVAMRLRMIGVAALEAASSERGDARLDQGSERARQLLPEAW